MVQISKEDLAKLAIGWGVANFLTKGALERPIQSATIRAITKAAPAIGRAVIRYGPAVVGTAARVTPTGLAVSTGAILAIQNREKIADLAAQGYEIAAPAVPVAQDYLGGVAERSMEFAKDPKGYAESIGAEFDPFRPIGGLSFPVPKKKKPTKFNKAVKKGMSIIKASTSYGKKGTINNAKKAFTAVTKTASTVNKTGKVAKSGIKRKIGLSIRSIL